MTKLTPRFFITILAFAIFGSLIYLSYFANDKMMYAFSASENSTSNETSTNNNTNINSNSTENLTALIPSNFSTLDMNSTNVTTITAPSNSNFSTRPMNNTNATTTSTGVSNSNVTLLYEYPDLGFKIKYPPSWEKVQYGRAVKAYGEGVIANLLSPLENSEDKFKDYVLIKIENLTSPQLGKTPANNSIGGKPTYQVVFERPNLANKSDTIRIMKEWIPLNDKALVIELDAEKSRFAHYLPLAMEMINSIELNGVGSSPAVTSTNQSLPLQQQSNVTTSSPEEATVSADNNTKTSSVIEKLLKRDIDKNETAFESQAGNEINTTK